jgi:hypothetical protein
MLSDSNREGTKTRDLQSPPDTITGLSIHTISFVVALFAIPQQLYSSLLFIDMVTES